MNTSIVSSKFSGYLPYKKSRPICPETYWTAFLDTFDAISPGHFTFPDKQNGILKKSQNAPELITSADSMNSS